MEYCSMQLRELDNCAMGRRRLDKFQMRCYLKILKINWKQIYIKQHGYQEEYTSVCVVRKVEIIGHTASRGKVEVGGGEKSCGWRMQRYNKATVHLTGCRKRDSRGNEEKIKGDITMAFKTLNQKPWVLHKDVNGDINLCLLQKRRRQIYYELYIIYNANDSSRRYQLVSYVSQVLFKVEGSVWLSDYETINNRQSLCVWRNCTVVTSYTIRTALCVELAILHYLIQARINRQRIKLK